MTATEKKFIAIKALLIAAIIVFPMIGCLWILAGIKDFSRVRNFKRPLFCILLAESASQDGGSGTYAGLCYSFEIKENFAREGELPEVSGYTARILNTPVMAGVRD